MPEVVYKSSHPDVLAACHAYEDERRAFLDATDALAAEAGEGWEPLRLRNAYVWMVGLNPDGDRIPDGPWRKSEYKGYVVWVPAKRSAAGKSLAARMEALKLRGRPILPGMPSLIIADGKFYEHGIVSDAVPPTTIWVPWGTDPEAVGPDDSWCSTAKEVDRSLWERAKLSEFYAVQEAKEALASV